MNTGAAPDILRRIAARRREHVAAARAADPQLAAAAAALTVGEPRTAADNAFLAALVRATPLAAAAPAGAAMSAMPAMSAMSAMPVAGAAGGLASPARVATAAIIAEVKMGSPRLGSLHGRVDPLAQARIYGASGAAALSVVVEPEQFHGSYDLLTACQAASGLPAIAKDFVIDPVQLLWAHQAGAAAVLLIAALLEAEELAHLAGLARGLGLVPLVETHDAADVAKLLGEPWELVGVNNRDLRDFSVDLERSIALLPWLPAGALKVAESGIRDALDAALLADSGFDALLIGESLLLAGDPAQALRAFAGGGGGVAGGNGAIPGEGAR